MCYATGLRISEAVSLKPAAIDSQRMVIRVEAGKGRKDRYVMLSPTLLKLLRTYWKGARPKEWLFPGDRPGQPITACAVEIACRQTLEQSGLGKAITPHSLIRQAIQNALAADTIAQRLKERYVKYIILANAGGIVACLGIEGALVGKSSAAPIIPFSAVAWPMWLFLFGLICGGLVVSLERARAVDFSEQQGREALRLIRETGRIVPTVESAFSSIERKGLKHLTLAINVLGVIGQFSFFAGAIWGLVRIGSVQ